MQIRGKVSSPFARVPALALAAAGLMVMTVAASSSTAVADRAPAPCATHAFHISEARSQGAGGSFYLALSFRNVTHTACTTVGFPGVTLLGAGDRRLRVARRVGTARSRLTVRPGARVYSYVVYGETPVGRGCSAVKAVKVYAPDSRQASVVRLPHGSAICAARSSVYPMQRRFRFR